MDPNTAGYSAHIIIIIIIIIISSSSSSSSSIQPLGPVWAGTRAQSGDWYGSGTLHPGQVLRGSLPLLSPAFRRSHFRRQVPPRPKWRVRS